MARNENNLKVVWCDRRTARRLRKAARKIKTNPNADLETFLLEAAPLVSILPMDLRRELLRMKDPQGRGALLIRGLPVDPKLGPTPDGGERPMDAENWTGEALLLAIGHHFLGSPFTLANEKKGAIPADIVPVLGREESLSNEGSKAVLGFHREICFDPELSPSYLALHCLRQDPEASVETLALDARDVVAAIAAESTELLELARSKSFRTRCPASVEKETGQVVWSEPHALIEGTLDNPGLALDENVTEGIDEAADAGLKRISKIVRHLAAAIVLQPGDLLVLNNRRVCHARSGFTAEFGPQARWLLRAYFKADPWEQRLRHLGERRLG